MHLCQVVPSLEVRHGGPSRSVRALSNSLAQAGDYVELLATAEPGDVAAPGPGDRAEITIFPRIAPRRIARSPALRSHLMTRDADCIHHHSLWLRTLFYAAKAARRHDCPLVISPRGMMSPWAWQHHRWRKQLATWLIHPGALRQVAGWHATSLQEANDIRALGFHQPLCISPNGVDLPTIERLNADRVAWQTLCPATAQRPVALFYSRLHRKKRVRELIDLWLAAPRGDWLLLVVGTAEEYTAEEIQADLAARGAKGKIQVFDGANHPPPYAVASLFLLPSHSENFGLVIAEALAAGVPALVTDTTPWHGLNGANSGWSCSWEEFPKQLLTSLGTPPTELRAMGRRGSNWMARDYSWTRAAQILRGFYRDLRHGNT